ncbi:MAG: M1 family aminopeptidase [Planctomycetota bacterium]|jgi:aminopeptidase N
MNSRFSFSLLLSISIHFIAFATGYAGTDPVDVISYKIDVVIGEEEITETVIMTAQALKKVKALELELADTMKIQSCHIEGEKVLYERKGWDCELDLSKHKLSKGEFSLTFDLKGKPYTKFSKSRGGFTRTNICKEHAYIRSQYAWYPRKSDDPALYDITITSRNDWQVRTAGDLEGKKDEGDFTVWHFNLKHPDRRTGLVAGDYSIVEEESPQGILIDAMVYSGHEESGKALLRSAAGILEYYASLFGPVSLDRFTLVEMPAAFGEGSGYGETGYVLIGTGAFDEEGEASWAESLLAHEVCHAWWGHEVCFKHFASEMLATYGTHRYMEMAQGEEAVQQERKKSIAKFLSVAERQGEVNLEDIRDWGAQMNPAVYSAHAYEKGAMLLHILESTMGRAAFDKTLKDFLDKYRGATIDYRTVAKDLAGRKWTWVFDQWGKKGIPSLSEEHKVTRRGSSYHIQGSLTQEGTKKPFKIDLALRAVSDDRVHDHVVSVKKKKTAFKFTCPFSPDEIIMDPESRFIFSSSVPADVEALTDKIFEVANNPGLRDEDKLTGTLRDIERVLKTKPEHESVFHTAKGRCLFRLGRFDEALEEFEIALKGGAGGPFHRQWIYLRMGCIADLQKKRSDAKKYYKKAMGTSGSDFAYKKAERFLEKPYRGHERDG